MKQLILIVALALSINAYAQDDTTVTLVVSGQGKTQDEAKQVALRSAIEQAFGAFISSKTEILNDKLVKDEIVSVTNGNIQKFDVLSEVQLPDGGYGSTLKAVVSVTKLTSFCENKGLTVEFKGGLFAMNAKLQKLNEENEVAAIRMLCNTSKLIIDKMFDYSISSNEPKSVDGNSSNWEVLLAVGVKLNANFNTLKDYLNKSLYEIAMNMVEVNKYASLNKISYPIKIKTSENSDNVFFRKEQSLALLEDLTWYIYFAQANFIFNDGINKYSLYQIKKSSKGKIETNFGGESIKIGCEFLIDREFESEWAIQSGCCFPICCMSNSCNYEARGSYQTSKEIINKLRLNIIKGYNEHNKFLKTNLEIYKNRGEGEIIIEEAEKKIKDHNIEINEILEKFADSTTVFISRERNTGYKSYGYPKNKKEIEDCFYINLIPPVENVGIFKIKKIYTTDDLGKITNFSVQAGKLEEIKK